MDKEMKTCRESRTLNTERFKVTHRFVVESTHVDASQLFSRGSE